MPLGGEASRGSRKVSHRMPLTLGPLPPQSTTTSTPSPPFPLFSLSPPPFAILVAVPLFSLSLCISSLPSFRLCLFPMLSLHSYPSSIPPYTLNVPLTSSLWSPRVSFHSLHLFPYPSCLPTSLIPFIPHFPLCLFPPDHSPSPPPCTIPA